MTLTQKTGFSSFAVHISAAGPGAARRTAHGLDTAWLETPEPARA